VADHYLAINDGVEGEKYSDFIVGVANTVGVNQIELRVQDGTQLSKKDIHMALKSFMRYFENSQQAAAGGFQVSG
jgi:hypothetical protein